MASFPSRIRLWLPLLPLLLLSGGCRAPTLPEDVTVRIEGRVFDAVDSAPLAGARVVLRRVGFNETTILTTAQTNTRGEYSLTARIPGSCLLSFLSVEASADGYRARRSDGWGEERTVVTCTRNRQTIDFALRREEDA